MIVTSKHEFCPLENSEHYDSTNPCSSASLCASALFGRRGAGSTSREGQLRSSGTASRLTRRLRRRRGHRESHPLIHRVTISSAPTLAAHAPKIQNQRLFHPRRSFSAARLEPLATFCSSTRLNLSQLVGRPPVANILDQCQLQLAYMKRQICTS